MDDEEYEYRDDLDDDPCDHENRDIDILSGRCQCYQCGESWYATGAEIDAELKFQSEYAEMMDRENRRQWWRDLFAPLTEPFRRLKWRIYEWNLRRKFPDHASDDIPF